MFGDAHDYTEESNEGDYNDFPILGVCSFALETEYGPSRDN